MLIGYARTSTVEQDAGIEAQERDLRALGCERIFREQVSAMAPVRPQLEAALAFARDGDVLVITKPDRLARSVMNLLAIVETLKQKGVGLRVLSMGLDTTGPESRLMLTVLGAVAEFEVDLMRCRQREGIAKAKMDGKYKGRAPTARAKGEQIKAMAAKGIAKAQIARELDVGLRSVFRVLGETEAHATSPAP
jgi:DNA invertase Pin-like site-specific DNA recombinase